MRKALDLTTNLYNFLHLILMARAIFPFFDLLYLTWLRMLVQKFTEYQVVL